MNVKPLRPSHARLALAGALAMATLCASGARAESLSPKSLKVPAVATVLHLDQSFRYEDPDAKGMFADATPERGLLAGDYVAELEDAGGTFFRGAGTCVLVMTLPRSKTQIFGEGGVYVPKDPAQPFRIYRYRQLGTEHVLAQQPDANGDWSVPAEQQGRSLLVIGSTAPPHQEPNPPESLCGTPVPQADSGSHAPGVGAVATVPHAPIAGGVGSLISTLLINGIIASGRGDIFLVGPPPADVVAREAAFARPSVARPAAPIVAAASGAAVAVAAPAPGHVRPLDAALVDGHTWIFPHLRDPAHFGQVELHFLGDHLTASNARGSSGGRYVVSDNRVCVDFDGDGWSHVCYYVEDVASAPDASATAMVVNAATGARSPLTIR